MSRSGGSDPIQIAAEEPGRGRLAGHPTQIPLHGWKDVVWRTVAEINRDQLPRVAAGVTFYTLLAIVPALAVFVSLYGLVADIGQVQSQLAQMSRVIPGDVLEIIGDQMRRLAVERKANLSLAFAFSLLVSVWTASNAVRALVEGVNIAYDEQEKRNIVQLMAITYAATFGALTFLILVTGLLVAMPIAMTLLGLGGFAAVWIPLRWAVLLAVAAGAFTLLYRYGPCRARARWRWVIPGGVFAAVVWLGGSLIFSWFLNNVARYDVTYGSLGAVIGFMMWIWISSMIVLIGAELNAEIEHQTALDSTTGPEAPLGERGATMADTVGKALTTTLADAIGRVRQGAGGFVTRLRRRG
ncbi:YihY/virulence factor BrkB family protein [Phenylobacterium sp.]|uniref:YihY/virulence factor BrkB family protein n=1 Tax=Phenylobacterium sp. TaxID=1871053 RepID=UPI0027312392|nr:YihY/virulence factor BrkB family protein [Phenylobacterium sp.]MDP1875430.1 YihY/virulence factor BrkB family protein [Phenylobacterium sp.]MDP3489677.1 YihY/virulence factor BrkB family protein [Phenylobacterium sp.]